MMTITNLTYIAAIIAITLDLFIWRPDHATNTEQLRPEHTRGYAELKALAVQRSDDAWRQRHLGHPSFRHRDTYRQVEEDCNSRTPKLTRHQYRACLRSARLDGGVRR